MIFKNEAGYIAEAIESILPIVDECILVDSGSDDGSEKIVFNLQKQNSKIKYFLKPWPGDFSDQKNFAIQQATLDWIIFLDADERIDKQDHSTLLKAIQNKNMLAYNLTIRNYTNDFTEYGFQICEHPLARGFVPTHLHRLFQRNNSIRYRGILHERIEPSLEDLGAKTKSIPVVIHHLGPLKAKDLGLQRQRYEFYEGLGRKKVSANPTSAQAHWELGVVLQKQRKLTEASKEFKSARELDSSVEEFEVYYAMSLFQQADWNSLKALTPQFERTQMFCILAKAQTEPKYIDDLDLFRKDFHQVALFIFELSAIHQRNDRIDRDRSAAMNLFGDTGLVEFLEGSVIRKRGDMVAARRLLEISKTKNCSLAEREIKLLAPL